MANINRIKIPGDNTVHNIVGSVHYVKGTQTAATGNWTGNLNLPALYDGLTIMYYLPWAGSGNATLNLTLSDGSTTGAKNCYYNTSRLTTHYGKGCNIIMTYHPAGSITIDGTPTTDDRWIANANYADGNSVAYYISSYYNYFVAGPNKIFPYTIVMQNADGRWESIVTSSSTGTSKARNTHGFRLGQLAYLNANSTYAENAKVGDNQISYHKSDLIDHRYSFNTANNSTSGTTTKKPVYLVGAINASDGLFYLDATWWTQTLPTTADGKLYIYLGDAFDYYRMSFVIDHPVYWYRNGMIREFAQDAATVNGLTVEKAVPSNAVFTDTTYTGTGAISVNASTHVISTTAEVNQNAFSNVKVGSTTVAADTKTDTLELVGSNVTLTPDATNDKVTIGITKANVTTALGYTPPTTDTNTTYTLSADGANVKLTPSTGSATTASLNDLINGLSEGSSPATRNDYAVVQYAGGGTSTKTYHRRSLANVFKALNSSDITTALGFTPYNSTNPNGYTKVESSTNGKIKINGTNTTVYTHPGSGTNPHGTTAADVGAIPTSSKGAANGVAELDANGLVPTSQLPSFVDDVLEYSSKSAFPATGETGKIYVALDTNLTYRWSGTAYVEISPSLALGETSSTAYRGDRGKIAYDHSQSAHARTDATAVSFSRSLTSGTKIGTITINGTGTDLYCQTNTDTKNTAGSTDTSSKIFLIGATSQAANPQTYSDNEVYVTSGVLRTKNAQASAIVAANTANSSTQGGLSLYGTSPSDYGIAFRGTGNGGKHGYVQGDWAQYHYMAGADNRGWIFNAGASTGVASISKLGHAVFNGSVTVGGNAGNTSGCKMEYNTTTQSLDFIFV